MDCQKSLTPLAEEYEVKTVFFGGGTPSLLTPEQICRIMQCIKDCIAVSTEAENTMEVNPGTIQREMFDGYLSAGINRISFGLQSMQDEELACLGRIHDSSCFLDNYQSARIAGFNNINIDIMYNIPGQTKESFRSTLLKLMELKPEHISAYSLIVEEETPFYDLFCQGKLSLPGEDEEEAMDLCLSSILESCGYRQYEISNYAREGYACRHNITYWQRGEYLGLGLGAASLLQEVRFNRTRSLSAYMAQAEEGEFFRENEQQLSISEAMEEFMFLGLRMNEGVSESQFKSYFHRDMEEVYKDVLERLEKNKMICRKNGQVCLSETGRRLGNQVFGEFLLS